jgi:hypothetical protein
MHSTNRGTCVYCRKRRYLTRDHLPPQILFAKPRPSNLVTVPACNSCNQKASRDDHYFGLVIKAGIDSEQFPGEFQASLDDIRKLGTAARRGLAKRMLAGHSVELAEASSGLLVQRFRYGVDKERVHAVIERIVRGFYFRRRNFRLPPSHRVWAALAESPSAQEASFIQANGSFFVALDAEPLSDIGSGVFTHRGLVLPGRSYRSFWYFSFFHKYVFLAATLPRA